MEKGGMVENYGTEWLSGSGALESRNNNPPKFFYPAIPPSSSVLKADDTALFFGLLESTLLASHRARLRSFRLSRHR